MASVLGKSFGLLLIMAALLAGEGAKNIFALPTPAPVLAIIILVAVQFILPAPLRDGLHNIADFLLRHMVLFFIPVVMVFLEEGALLKQYGLFIAGVIIVSSAISLPLLAILFARLHAKQKI